MIIPHEKQCLVWFLIVFPWCRWRDHKSHFVQLYNFCCNKAILFGFFSISGLLELSLLGFYSWRPGLVPFWRWLPCPRHQPGINLLPVESIKANGSMGCLIGCLILGRHKCSWSGSRQGAWYVMFYRVGLVLETASCSGDALGMRHRYLRINRSNIGL